VYLVARLFPIFFIDSVVLNIVTWVGASSALLAAMVACTQTDIKRVLAYSTMSQIGYMMFALGIATNGGEESLGYMGSMFHLFTHAFFKSLLFLAAGAIIHLVHSNDMRDMGGLRKVMPVTHISFLIGCLAIAGIPPFAGFFSKEEILMAAFESNKAVYVLALFTAGLTAFYMFRLYFSIFWNKDSPLAMSREDSAHHSEGTFSMKLPLIILSICATAAGLVPFSQYVTANGAPMNTHLNILFSLTPVSASVIAILFAAKLYKRENEKPGKIAASIAGLYTVVVRKFYIDELYRFITKKIVFNLIGRSAAWIDRKLIDGCINGMGQVTAATSNVIKGLQSGRVQNYALYFFAGIAGLAVVFIYVWKF
ncbi:MAG: NADH-quinone oxidoreductase subunit L, partial [Bacteroidota bacterium]|nr:NADH-quinone oxidoreductase subunit L [Bacteroidota bacterium]